MTEETPSPETIRIAGEVLKFAALLDDRVAAADKARIFSWAKQMQRHPRIARDDYMDGLQAFYDSPSERAIQVGDLIHHSRLAWRTRVEKEDDAVREARIEDHAAKAAVDDIKVLTADAIGERIKNRTERLAAAERALQSCHGKRESVEALKEFFAARAQAKKSPRKKAS